MAQDIIDQKFSILFDWFDHANNGWVTRDDFAHAADLFTALAPPGDQENRNAIRAGFDRWWDLMAGAGAADAGQRMGRSQFVAVMRSHVTHPDHYQDVIVSIENALLRALDTNHSGTLSADEYVHLFEGLGIPATIATPAFQMLDRDKDGSISHDEYRAAVEEFCLSTAPEAAGHHLLGSPAEAK